MRTTQGRSGHCRGEPEGKASRWDIVPFAIISSLKGDAQTTESDFSGGPHLQGSSHGKLAFGVEVLSVGRGCRQEWLESCVGEAC